MRAARQNLSWASDSRAIDVLAARMEHTKASISLDVYTHFMPPEEASPEALRAVLVVATASVEGRKTR